MTAVEIRAAGAKLRRGEIPVDIGERANAVYEDAGEGGGCDGDVSTSEGEEESNDQDLDSDAEQAEERAGMQQPKSREEHKLVGAHGAGATHGEHAGEVHGEEHGMSTI